MGTDCYAMKNFNNQSRANNKVDANHRRGVEGAQRTPRSTQPS